MRAKGKKWDTRESTGVRCSGCWVCRPETPAERAHTMFTLLGLRHLCVVDENSRVRGIITRRDLDYAAGHGAWRRNKMAPAPDPVSPSGKSFPLCGPTTA